MREKKRWIIILFGKKNQLSKKNKRTLKATLSIKSNQFTSWSYMSLIFTYWAILSSNTTIYVYYSIIIIVYQWIPVWSSKHRLIIYYILNLFFFVPCFFFIILWPVTAQLSFSSKKTLCILKLYIRLCVYLVHCTILNSLFITMFKCLKKCFMFFFSYLASLFER